MKHPVFLKRGVYKFGQSCTAIWPDNKVGDVIELNGFPCKIAHDLGDNDIIIETTEEGYDFLVEWKKQWLR